MSNFPSKKIVSIIKWLILPTAIFIAAYLIRLPYRSNGIDQWDVTVYVRTLAEMKYYKEVEWTTLLLIQKAFWLLFPSLTPQQVLSTVNVILSSLTLSLVYIQGLLLTNSVILSIVPPFALFFFPVFALHSIMGMQDMAQTFFIQLYILLLVFAIKKKNKKYFLATVFCFVLTLGVRINLLIFAPLLLYWLLINKNKINLKFIYKAFSWFILGLLVWNIPKILFIPSLKNASGVHFFIYNQFKLFSPFYIGFLNKLGTYPLFTGYNQNFFYKLPAFIFAYYMVLTLNWKKNYLYRWNALFFYWISILFAWGLYSKFLNTKPIYIKLYLLAGLGLIIIEAIAFIFRKKLKIKIEFTKIDFVEKVVILFDLALIISLSFNYIFTSFVFRYLLPVFPLILLIIIVSIHSTKNFLIKIAISVLFISLFLFGDSIKNTQTILNNFKQLDTRSTLAQYIKKTDGIFYDGADMGDMGISSYLKEYAVTSKVRYFINNQCNFKVRNNKNIYAYFYGPIAEKFMENCPNIKFSLVKKIQRSEIIIEDSVGNIGYYIYKVTLL